MIDSNEASRLRAKADTLLQYMVAWNETADAEFYSLSPRVRPLIESTRVEVLVSTCDVS